MRGAPVTGTRLIREWQGVEQIVTVTAAASLAGSAVNRLSAVARAITGTRWAGWVFFGLKKSPEGALTKPIVRKLRCAVYAEILEEGLEQEFNSLHAQRDSCEAYIASQRSEGWVLVRDQYDDGGISAGRWAPGLKRLLADVDDGLVDVVVSDRSIACRGH